MQDTADSHNDYTFHNDILDGVPCVPAAANDDNKCLKHSFASLSAHSVSGNHDVSTDPRPVHARPTPGLCLDSSCGSSAGLAQGVLVSDPASLSKVRRKRDDCSQSTTSTRPLGPMGISLAEGGDVFNVYTLLSVQRVCFV